MYWRKKLRELGESIEKKTLVTSVILFGSLSKGEAKADSDVDLAVFGTAAKVDITQYEKKLKRKIQVFWFSKFQDIKNKDLANNIKIVI